MGHLHLKKYKNHLSLKNKLYRLGWLFCYYCFFRFYPGRLFNRWRIFLLRCFGARIGRSSHVYASAEIWMPNHLFMGENSAIAPHVKVYNPGMILIGSHVTISQYAYLCAASHDITRPDMALLTAPITISSQAWIAADAFIGMGVTVGEGAVVGARACVFKDVEPWTVVGGNPARFIKKRELTQ